MDFRFQPTPAVIPAHRLPANSPSVHLARCAPWAAAFAVLGLILFIVVRSCAYETAPVFAYAAYFALHVLLPGIVALHAISRGPLPPTLAIALGVPTGYAIEIFSFLALAAMGARDALNWLPLLWAIIGAGVCWRRREWPLRCQWTLRHGGIALSLAVLFFGTVALAATQMFAESPLVDGFPQRPIFHDWMYLVSRAAAIKHHWPLEDPSLAGSPLQYHYFMLVHGAAASTVTGLDVSVLLLRFVMIPLGAVLVVQAYALGRMVARSPWAGVLTAFLTVAASELSFSADYREPEFLGLFSRWLYVSPTFFFGMIFFGALLLAVAITAESARFDIRHMAWLALLAAAGTGAKGTMTPVVLAALGAWAGWQWIRTRRFPTRLVLVGSTLSAGFLAIYLAIMASWGTGQAAFEPFRILQLTGFWKTHFASLERGLAGWLPAWAAGKVALGVCAAVAFAGTAGVRLLAVADLAHRNTRERRTLVPWLAAVFLTGSAMGMLIHLHVYSELYIILLIRLPMAVLAASFLVAAGRQVRAAPLPAQTPVARRIGRRIAVPLAAAGLGLTAAVQCGLWVARQRAGLTEWLRQSPHITLRSEMVPLCEAMAWIRTETERDAILVANAFTPRHFQRGRGDLVDHTTVGVHFYYSAFSERRLFVEGPTYLHDDARVRRRMERAAAIFYEGRPPATSLPGDARGYAIIDRSLKDGARVALADEHRVYRNARYDIYRLPRKASKPPATVAFAALSDE